MAFLVQNLSIFASSQKLHLGKFKVADFKYEKKNFKILAQKYPNKAFLVLNLFIFFSFQNFAVTLIRSCPFQI